ncbi:MAG TPA: transglycosylase SLT domain-containing protein, partial [Pyrinomonadaceae bacterium]|nr:transglycosylase SLT domain-containing protein [Pyrinomonadaceae bacterium]
MIFSAQQVFLCAAASLLALSCARVENKPAANAPAAAAAAAEAPLYAAEEPFVLSPEDQTEDALAATRRADAEGGGGQTPRLTPQEHMRRAAIYHVNRAFEEARNHWRALIERFPSDTNVPAAHFGVGRTLFQERRYEEALPVFQQLGDRYPNSVGGRDGFYYVAATLLRLNRFGEAAARYAEYVERFPKGERTEAAYLNIIDSLREAGRYDDALPWIGRTRARFPGTPTDVAALFARLRLDVARKDWPSALRSADELGRVNIPKAANTSAAEVAYLRAFSLEMSGQKEQAARAYQGIADGVNSYYGARATERLEKLGGQAKAAGKAREERVLVDVRKASGNYPAPHREIILREAKRHKLDPRFVLSIMRAESSFNARAKSGAGARGLLQMTPDMAAKYATAARITVGGEDDLFRPEINIPVASAYLADLERMFP